MQMSIEIYIFELKLEKQNKIKYKQNRFNYLLKNLLYLN